MFEQIIEVEKLGFDQAWVTEHHFGGYGGTLPHPPTFLAAAAQMTSRIRLGVAVAVLPLHNPLDLAESYAMADVISDGRSISASAKAASRSSIENSASSRDEATARFHESIGDYSPGMVRRGRSIFTASSSATRTSTFCPSRCSGRTRAIWVGATHCEETFRWAGEMIST